MSAKKSQAVEKKGEQAIETYDYGDSSGEGFRDQTPDHLVLPFLNILQSNSPQVEEGVEGAKPGVLFNTVTEEMYPEGVTFVPAYKEQVFVEWVPRTKGGGFVGVHQVDSEVVRRAKENATDFGKYSTPEGNDLVETFYVYGVTLEKDRETPGEMVVLAFTSTKIKVYKRWNTKMSMFQLNVNGRKQQPPLFAHRVEVTTKKEKNEKGTWHNFVLAPALGDVTSSLLSPGHPALETALSCRDMVAGGLARASYESQQKTAGGEADSDTPF